MTEEREVVHGYQINSKKLVGYRESAGRWFAVYEADTPRGARFFLVTRTGKQFLSGKYQPHITSTTRPKGFTKNPWN